MSDLIGFEVPKIDWTQGPDLVQRFRRFKQKCELLFEGPLKPRTDEQKCKYLLLWTGDYGLDLFNTWNLSEEQQKHLHEYWTRLEEHVKPQSNYIVLSESTNDKGEITKLRVCLDPRDLNKWIKREQHYTKTVDEVVTQLNDAKFFTLVDAKKGYWHVPLDEASSYLTTFSTPFGRFRFLRLPFGLTVAQDVFQKQLDSALEGLSGVTGIADDTFVLGSTENEHDRNLANLMERARQKGIVFNK